MLPRCSCSPSPTLTTRCIPPPCRTQLSYCNDLKIDFKVKKAAEQIAINAKPQVGTWHGWVPRGGSGSEEMRHRQ